MSGSAESSAREALIDTARRAAARAFVPASGFRVGAAVLVDGGAIVPGCNVETASYGLTICAERNAVFRAVADGARAIHAVAVWTELDEPAAPCGACRQVLAEFAAADCPVLLAGPGGRVTELTVGELLPRPFTFDTLDAARRGGTGA
ncbi:MAG: cytidine deaminase [Planctomycetes bacterium]|nr:cytidine deaminase [Planctomycetota bacterium]